MIEPIRVLTDDSRPVRLHALDRPADPQAEIIALADHLREAACKLTLVQGVIDQMVTLDAQKQQRSKTLVWALLLEAAEAVSHAEDAVLEFAQAKRAQGRL